MKNLNLNHLVFGKKHEISVMINELIIIGQ